MQYLKITILYTTTIYKIDKQQGPTYSTGNYIQYLVITYTGKESEKGVQQSDSVIQIYIDIYRYIYI